MTAPNKNLQFLRSFTAGNTPDRLKAGEVAFNVADKLMFVGDGSSYFTAFDGVQTASSYALEGWFAVDLDAYPSIEAIAAAALAAQSDATDALTRIGVMNGLDTSDQETLVGAINEVLAAAAAAQLAANNAGNDASQGLTTKLDLPVNGDVGAYGQAIVSTNSGVRWANIAAEDVSYIDYTATGGLNVQVALTTALGTNVTQAGQITDAAADAQTGINLANTAQGSADAAQLAADAAQGTADQALTAAQNAQSDADALDGRLTTVEGNVGDLILDVSGLQTSKQDSLGAGTEGQFLRYVAGSPTWSSFDPKLGSVATAMNVAAFEAIQAAAAEGDVVVIVDAAGLTTIGSGYNVSNLAETITENFSVSLIKDASGVWLLLATPGSLTQAAADMLYAAKTTSVLTGGGLTGGGDLSVDRTISISDNGVTYGKIQQATGKSLLGAGAAGNLGEVTLGSNLDIVSGVLEVSFDLGTF